MVGTHLHGDDEPQEWRSATTAKEQYPWSKGPSFEWTSGPYESDGPGPKTPLRARKPLAGATDDRGRLAAEYRVNRGQARHALLRATQRIPAYNTGHEGH